MTRHRRKADEAKSNSSSGLLSHVFSFVSKEIESFVLSATGGSGNQPASTRRAKSSGRRRGQDPEKNVSEDNDNTRHKSKTRHHRERERRFKLELPRPKPRSKSVDSTRKHHRDHSQPAYIDNDVRVPLASHWGRSTSPAPRPPSVFLVPPLPKLRKQPSITMPGALFPRSPSLMPDQPYDNQCTQGASNVPTSVQSSNLIHASDLGESKAGPSSTRLSTALGADSADPGQLCLDEYVSPWRTRSVSSVKDAVHRFNVTEGVEADFSLMLPSPHSSPVKPTSSARSVDEVSPRHPSLSSVAALSTCRKGKEQARDNRHDDDLDFVVCGYSGHDGVHAKERELDAAREEQREHEKLLNGNQSRRASDERERDKRRIRALEAEVTRLKEELSKSQVRSSPPPSLAPLPPPPPPPPPPPLPLRIDTAPHTPTSMFATARASLRHAMTPVEAPINNPGLNKTRRQGQPTVNVPSEKMAAFLLEIKTAKLRRVGSDADRIGGDGAAGPSGLSKSVSVASSASTGPSKINAKELLRRRSLASLRVPIGSSLAAPIPPSALAMPKEPEVRVGQKRKADVLGADGVMGLLPKRRMTQSSFQSSSEMSQHTAASSSELSTLSSSSLPSHSLPTNETDIATPSLCSDNDRDETSIEDRVPSTPPGPRTTTVAQKAQTETREGQIEVIDVDMEERSHAEPRTISPSSVPRRASDLFEKRPPTSPIPAPTPRRPSAPARTKRGATPKPRSLPSPESDVDDEDERLPQSTPVPLLSLIPVAKSKAAKPKPKPTLSGKGRPRATMPRQKGHSPISTGTRSTSSQSKHKKAHKRRQTLDEEIRTVEARSSDIDQCNDELDPLGEREDVFTTMGMRSKRRGFLAHGGGGGVPVFMGVGCVQGAGPDSADEDELTGTQPRRLSKPASQLSFIPRPKAGT